MKLMKIGDEAFINPQHITSVTDCTYSDEPRSSIRFVNGKSLEVAGHVVDVANKIRTWAT